MDDNFMKGVTHFLMGVGLAGLTISCKQMDIIADDIMGQATYLCAIAGGALMTVAGLSKIINIGGVA